MAAYLEGLQARLAEKGAAADSRAICAGCVDCEHDNYLRARARGRAAAGAQGRAAAVA